MLEEAANLSYASQLSLFNETSASQLTRTTQKNSSALTNKPAGFAPATPTQQNGLLHGTQASACDEKEDSSTEDLDDTLKFSPSLAKGVEFNDEEVWESFSHGSPQSHHGTESSNSDLMFTHSPPAQNGGWKSPVTKERIAGSANFPSGPPRLDMKDGGFSVKDSSVGPPQRQTFAVEKHKVTELPGHSVHAVSSTPNTKDSPPLLPPHFTDPIGSVSDGSNRGSELYVPPPPPSALVSKLFPVLRQTEEPRKLQCSNNSHQPHVRHSSEGRSPPSAISTSPVSSVEGDSGIRSLSSTSVALSDDLKFKLNQLEEEIAKYKTENTSLEKLRKEREEASVGNYFS